MAARIISTMNKPTTTPAAMPQPLRTFIAPLPPLRSTGGAGGGAAGCSARGDSGCSGSAGAGRCARGSYFGGWTSTISLLNHAPTEPTLSVVNHPLLAVAAGTGDVLMSRLRRNSLSIPCVFSGSGLGGVGGGAGCSGSAGAESSSRCPQLEQNDASGATA